MPRKSKAKSVSKTDQVLEDSSTITVTAVSNVAGSNPLGKKDTSNTSQSASGPYEDRRKEMQRRLQKLTLSMRGEGASEIDIKNAVIREKRKEEKKIIALEEKRANEAKASQNDVIIVPVAWKRNHSDKVAVDATCDALRRALFSTGLNPWLDCRREYSPGQKFAYWEHMGVQFRIEVGPEDIAAGVCRVVRAEKPGAYLEHVREKPGMNLRDIVKTLAKMGLSKCADMNAELMSSDTLIDRPGSQVDDLPIDEVSGNAARPAKLRRF